jgi:hypothetical protein
MSENKENIITTKKRRLLKDWRKLLYNRWIVKNIPFFLFLAALTVIYIANGHYADKTLRRIETAEKHLKEMEYEFKTTKRDVMFRSKESEVVKAVEPLGLKELTSPPMKIADSTDQ